MLHDPSHYEPPEEVEPIRLTVAEQNVLRQLASEIAEIAALPVHQETARLWQKLNDLESERPMVWVNEICWNEMNVDDELTLKCTHRWARGQEMEMRRLLYQWRHLPADMVVSDYLTCPLAIHSTDFGIIEDVDIAKTDATNNVVSRHFNVQIKDLEDIELIMKDISTVRYEPQRLWEWSRIAMELAEG